MMETLGMFVFTALLPGLALIIRPPTGSSAGGSCAADVNPRKLLFMIMPARQVSKVPNRHHRHDNTRHLYARGAIPTWL